MGTVERLGAEHLRGAVAVYRDALRAHQDALNRMNVYPVPDGDTGTNMALTLESVVAALDDGDGDGAAGGGDMEATCHDISRAALMGARGNSGVILSQILGGICQTLAGSPEAGPGQVAEALSVASRAAREAVMRPVEGTILTVAAAAAEGAGEPAARGSALVEVLEAARAAAAAALERTPDLLPVLKQAGVVDAGGAGLVLLLDALLHVTAGRPLPEPEPAPPGQEGPRRAAPAASPGGVADLRYEVMYLLEAPDDAVPSFKERWAAIGDSIVVVGGDGTWNCHIHTDDVGAAVEAALDHGGRPRQIRVTDLAEQVERESCAREPAGAAGHDGERPTTAAVAVAAGDGLGEILRSLGVHRVVAGGQSMNPSTAELLEAVESAPADEVVVLPNNANIVAVAEQVGALTAKTVRVVPTRAIGEGLAAMVRFDPGASAHDNAPAMADAARRVVSGEVARAVRASSSHAGSVAPGDWLGLSDHRIEVVAGTVAEAATGLLDKLLTEDHEVVTVLEGEGATPDDTGRITEWLERQHPGIGAEVHAGGQPVYPYVFSIE